MTTVTKKNLNEKRLVLTGVVNNDTFAIPAGYRVSFIVAEGVAAQAANITIGTTDNTDSLVETQAVPATAGALVALTLATIVYSTSAATPMIVTLSSADSVINLYVELDKFI